MRPARLGFLGFLLASSLALGSAGVAGCSSSSDGGASPGETAETGAHDARPSGDDAATGDDGAPQDAGADVTGHGEILGTLASGACGVIKSELGSTSPSLEVNLLVFTSGETYDRASLSPGGQRLYDTANAGGSSTESEVLSYEVLRYCDDAKLLKTETEIGYQPPDDSGANTITDLSVEIDGKKVGVSVTRAYKPASQPLNDAELKALLEKKLEGVIRSSQRVLPADRWVKQILHVFSVNKAATDAIARVMPAIDAAIKADTIVLVTETKGGGFVYCDPDPALGSECP
ncbi:MAG: hypothetical protein JWP97_3126 [Labilithrix sp.]|nr:hypothetical protein [Labilithrix sp.]